MENHIGWSAIISCQFLFKNIPSSPRNRNQGSGMSHCCFKEYFLSYFLPSLMLGEQPSWTDDGRWQRSFKEQSLTLQCRDSNQDPMLNEGSWTTFYDDGMNHKDMFRGIFTDMSIITSRIHRYLLLGCQNHLQGPFHVNTRSFKEVSVNIHWGLENFIPTWLHGSQNDIGASRKEP